MGPGVGSQPTQGPSRRLAVGCKRTGLGFWAWYLIKERGRERVKVKDSLGKSIGECPASMKRIV
jgi:hypothetical protein